MNFVNMPILLALPAVAIPIIIHIINRRRFRRMDWAAIEFLRAALQKNRRRILWEQILLLVLRCLIVLFLVLVFARPFRDYPIFGLDFLGKADMQCYILVDDSPSMGRFVEGRMLSGRCNEGIMRLCEAMKDSASRAVVSVFTSGKSQPLIIESLARRGGPERIKAVLDSMETVDKPFDPAAGLNNMLAAIREAKHSNAVVFVFSDFQVSDWSEGEEAEVRQKIADPLRKIAAMNKVILVNAAPSDSDNVSITGLDNVERVIFSKRLTQFKVGVRNWSDRPVQPMIVRAESDGREFPPLSVPALSPRQSVDLTLPLAWESSGDHGVILRLERTDSMMFDNIYRAVVSLESRLKVLVAEPQRLETEYGEPFFLARAIDPYGSGAGGFEVRSTAIDKLGETPLDDYCTIFLVNLPSVPEDAVGILKEYVRNGGSMIVFLGDNVRSDAYNSDLFDAGKGLFPGSLEGMVKAAANGHFSLNDFQWDHDLLQPFDKWKFLFQSPRFVTFWRLNFPAANAGEAGPEVLARFTDADRSPALVHYALGKGHLFLFASCADRDWTDWPASETGRIAYVSVVHRLLELYSRSNWRRDNFVAGTGIEIPLDLSSYGDSAHWFFTGDAAPGGAGESFTERKNLKALKGEYEEQSNRWLFKVSEDDTLKAGFSGLELSKRAGGTELRLFSGRIPVSESEPVILAAEGVAEFGPNVSMKDVSGALASQLLSPRREYWRSIAVVLACLVLAESLLAFVLGNPQLQFRIFRKKK